MSAAALPAAEALKKAAGETAAALVEDGMVVGLGTGSTAAFAVAALGLRAQAGLRIVGIPTSERTAEQARSLGIPLTDFAQHQQIDLTIDGADEVKEATLDLIKGLGGALLREKIVASASRRLVIIADASKLVTELGQHAPVPVEIVPFGLEVTMARLVEIGARPVLRRDAAGKPFVTDGGHHILDCHTGPIADPPRLSRQIIDIVGVVETGLFLAMASDVLLATPEGVRHLVRAL